MRGAAGLRIPIPLAGRARLTSMARIGKCIMTCAKAPFICPRGNPHAGPLARVTKQSPPDSSQRLRARLVWVLDDD